MPASKFISVDLPAPFAPVKACTSPACPTRSTASSAATAPKRLPTPRNSSSAGVNCALLLGLPFFGQLARPPVVGLVQLRELCRVGGSDILRRDHEAARHRLARQDLQPELGRLLAGARREGHGAALLVLGDPLHPAVAFARFQSPCSAETSSTLG